MSFIEVQQAFMAHIRNPEHNAKPEDVSERRIKIYNELFFNNIEGFVLTTNQTKVSYDICSNKPVPKHCLNN